MSIQTIYDSLIRAGMTKEGASALMGNMQAESRMKSNIVEIGRSKLSDEQYTAAADNGLIDFVRDTIGYGLCQWTHWERKKRLLDFAKKENVSVGDESMQVRYAVYELKNYFESVYDLLCTSHDLFYLTQLVCTDYESPKYNNISNRYTFAQHFIQFLNYNPPKKIDTSILVLKSLMAGDGYWNEELIDSTRSDLFKKKIVEWANDIASM